MEFNFASRLDSFEEGIFATLNDKKNELVKAGRKVYNMSVGTCLLYTSSGCSDYIAWYL